MASLNITLRKQVAGQIMDLYPKTTAAMVIDTTTQKSLATIIGEMAESIDSKTADSDFQALKTRFDNLVQDAPEAYDTLVEISTYISTHKDEYTALLELAGNKVEKVDGYGLSKNDFTDELCAKLTALYTKDELDTKFQEINDRLDSIAGGALTCSAADVTYTSEGITNVEQALDKLLYVKPAVSAFNMTPSTTTYEKGSSVSDITFTWSYNKKGITTQTLTDVASLDADARTASVAGPYTTNKTFTLSASDGTNSCSSTKTIAFNEYIHYGQSAIGDDTCLTSEFILGLTAKKFGSAKSSIGTITVNAAEGNYIYVAFPNSWTSTLIFKIGGFDTEFVKVGTVSHVNASGYTNTYAVYRSGQAGLGNTSMAIV